jgi:hypothetical protein
MRRPTAGKGGETIMTCHDKIRAKLAGEDGDLERRVRFLANFLTAFERGGAEEAAGTLAHDLESLGSKIEVKLSELQKLL